MRNYKQNYYDSDLTYRKTYRVRIYTRNGQKKPLEAKKIAFQDMAIEQMQINKVEKIRPFKRKSSLVRTKTIDEHNNIQWTDTIDRENHLRNQERDDAFAFIVNKIRLSFQK